MRKCLFEGAAHMSVAGEVVPQIGGLYLLGLLLLGMHVSKRDVELIHSFSRFLMHVIQRLHLPFDPRWVHRTIVTSIVADVLRSLPGLSPHR
jgi:hypothetical protein